MTDDERQKEINLFAAMATGDYDSGTFADSEANSGDQTQNRLGLSSNYKYKGGLLKALFSINTVIRNLVSGGEASFKGTSKNIDIINKVKLSTICIFCIFCSAD